MVLAFKQITKENKNKNKNKNKINMKICKDTSMGHKKFNMALMARAVREMGAPPPTTAIGRLRKVGVAPSHTVQEEILRFQ